MPNINQSLLNIPKPKREAPMNRSIIRLRRIAMLIGTLALTGLSQAESVNPGRDAIDILAISYEATLPEGIDFRKPGYPTFIKQVKGISGLETWGPGPMRTSALPLKSNSTNHCPRGLPCNSKPQPLGQMPMHLRPFAREKSKRP